MAGSPAEAVENRYNSRSTLIAARLRVVPLLCITALLLFTCRLYAFSYFWLDDFNNLYWVQRQSALQMLGYLVNPASRFFRPAGMAAYWLLWNTFGLTALPYHVLAWSLHAANTALVYWLLKRITKSHAGAAMGAILFASEALFSDKRSPHESDVSGQGRF